MAKKYLLIFVIYYFISKTNSNPFNKTTMKPANESINFRNLNKKYFTVNQIYEWLKDIKSTYDNITELIEIGKTNFNKSLILLKIGNPNTNVTNKKYFWFDSGIHAREWTSISTAIYSIDRILKETMIVNSTMNRFFNYYEIYFLVVTNPDGYEFSLKHAPLWRKNTRNFNKSKQHACFGVDINRNFDSNWMKSGSSSNICHSIYAGSEPFSEPESSSIKKFIISKGPSANWISFVSLHSYGGYWLYNIDPLNSQFSKDRFIKICKKPMVALRAIKKKYNYEYKFGTPANMLGYYASGSSDSWAILSLNITYSYAIEIGPLDNETEILKYGNGFHVVESKIEYIVQRAYIGIHQYLRTFLDKLSSKANDEIESECALEYENIISKKLK